MTTSKSEAKRTALLLLKILVNNLRNFDGELDSLRRFAFRSLDRDG
jgi:hypothetical protein